VTNEEVLKGVVDQIRELYLAESSRVS